jgi:DNA-directed RNA polymerase specialized sigma24 family protein
LTYEELQETLDLPAGTVKSRLYRARAALKDELAGGWAEPSAGEV